MNVFCDIATGSDDGTLLVTPARVVADRTLAMPEPRSLCEVQPDEDDYQWLCGWAKRLTPRHLQKWLSGFNSRMVAFQSGDVVLSCADAAGCLLLLLAAESARREASEGNIWPAVRRRFTDPVLRVLFDVQGQPRPEFKDAMEGAARKLGLRHIFGVAGTHNYYVSVYLQFGFTRKGIERLPHWLAGLPASEAVSCLIGDTEGRGARLGSESFESLWNILRAYRRNNVTESDVRRALLLSPWVLPDWSDALLEQAVKSREIGEYRAGSLEPLPLSFLAEPRLQWDSSAAPVFTTSVVNLADFDLTSDRYRVSVGDAHLVTLLRTDDGQYTTPLERVALPSTTADFTVTLADDNGTVVATQLVQLWDPDADVELFDLATGWRLDGYNARRALGKDYGLLVSLDLNVEPSGLRFHVVGSGSHGKRLHLLPAGDVQMVRVTMSDTGGEVSELWNSERNAVVRAESSEPSWASQVYTNMVPLGPERLERYRSIRIASLGSDVALQYVRVGGVPLGFTPDGDGAFRTKEFDISRSISATKPHQVRVKLGLRRGAERAVVERDCFANSDGVMRATGDGWKVVDPFGRLSAGDALRSTYRLVMSEMGAPVSDLALMEGSVFLDRAWSRPRGLRQLGGYGAPLEIRAPYNPPDDVASLVIASAVCDTGVLTGVNQSADGDLCLRFRDPLEPDNGYEVVLWSMDSSPLTYSAADTVVQQDHEWYLLEADYPGESCCVAVSYHGTLIGAWWPYTASSIGAVGADSALATAAMLRWIHAPVLDSGWLNAVQSFAWQYPAQALAAWLRDGGLPVGLAHRVASEQWGAVVREVFGGWEPDHYAAQEVISVLGDGASDDEQVSESLHLLLREDPLLMGRVAKAWIGADGLGAQRISRDRRRFIERLRFLFAGISVGGNRMISFQQQRLEQGRLDELLNAAAGEMGVDRGYVDRVVGRVLGPLGYGHLDDMNRSNAETALNVQPFRELLGLRILASLTNGV